MLYLLKDDPFSMQMEQEGPFLVNLRQKWSHLGSPSRLGTLELNLSGDTGGCNLTVSIKYIMLLPFYSDSLRREIG